MVLEVGSANGWGPIGMSRTRMDLCLDRARQTAEKHDASVTLLRSIREVEIQTAQGSVTSSVADILVRRQTGGQESPPLEVRVAIIGNVDSGKSTMVGVMTRSMLDDGRGLARSKVSE